MGSEAIAEKTDTGITLEQLRLCLPLNMRGAATNKIVKLINSKIDDSDMRMEFRENTIGWISALKEGRFSITEYVNAVKYVTHRLTGDGITIAWAKVFPERYQRLVDKGIPSKNISSHATLYNKSKLAIKVMERTLVPIYITNSDILQEAINVQANLMRTARSETVQQKASATLIEHLQVPEALKVQIDVEVSNDTVEDFRNVTRALAVQQRKMIESGGMSAGEVAEMTVVTKEKAAEEEVIEAEYKEMEASPFKGKGDLTVDFFPKNK